MTRIDPEKFDLPVEKIRRGYYSAAYFARTSEIVNYTEDLLDQEVVMQVWQKRDGIACGVDEAIAILRTCAGYYDYYDDWVHEGGDLLIHAVRDGDFIRSGDPVMHITGRYGAFAHLESVYLGALTRGTMVASNTRECVRAADGIPVLFFADRFDHFGTQERDGYAATIGGATDVATPAHARLSGKAPVGTMPHALIAVNDGDVAKAGKGFRRLYPDVPLVGLVDFNNDCVGDSLRMLDAFGKDLAGVRLDTSANMLDESLQRHNTGKVPTEDDYGVTPMLVRNVRTALDSHGGGHVKIYVSGGFNPEKIRRFVSKASISAAYRVDGFGVGSSLLKGNFDYTADIVDPVAKKGRKLNSGFFTNEDRVL